MLTTTLNLPRPYADALDDLVRMKLYPNRAEAIRLAVRDLLRKEHPKFRFR